MKAKTKLGVVGAAFCVFAVTGHHGGANLKGLTAVLDSVRAAPVTGSGGSPSQNIRLARRLAAHNYRWTGSQFSCLDTLWAGESGWSQYSDTRRSGLDPAGAQVFAYGIAQARPATKMPRAAWPPDMGGHANARVQEDWGLAYIHHIYGTPCAALAFKRSHGNQGY